MQLQNKHDCATSFIDAGNAFKKSDPNGECVATEINHNLKFKLHVNAFTPIYKCSI